MRFRLPSNLMTAGAQRALRGLRVGDQRVFLTGMALAALGWLRSTRGPKRRLLYRREIPAGSALVVRAGRDTLPEVEVRRVEGPT